MRCPASTPCMIAYNLHQFSMRPVWQRFAHLFAEADTMQMFIWHKDLFSVARYICVV